MTKASNEHAPMRLKKREVQDIGRIKELVRQCRTVRIGAVDEEGVFVVPMSFGFAWQGPQGDELTLWLHSAGEGRKARAFDGSPQVAIEMDIEDGLIEGDYACAFSFAYRSLMGSGRIRRVGDVEGKLEGLQLILDHMAQGAEQDFSPTAIERVTVYRVDVEHLSAKQRKAR